MNELHLFAGAGGGISVQLADIPAFVLSRLNHIAESPLAETARRTLRF